MRKIGAYRGKEGTVTKSELNKVFYHIIDSITLNDTSSIHNFFPIQNPGFYTEHLEQNIEPIDFSKIKDFDKDKLGQEIKSIITAAIETIKLANITKVTKEKLYISATVALCNNLYLHYKNDLPLFSKIFLIIQEVYQDLLGKNSNISYIKASTLQEILTELNNSSTTVKHNTPQDNLSNLQIKELLIKKRGQVDMIVHNKNISLVEQQDFMKYYKILFNIKHNKYTNDGKDTSPLHIQKFIYSIIPSEERQNFTSGDIERIHNILNEYIQQLDEFKDEPILHTKIKAFFSTGSPLLCKKQKDFNIAYNCVLDLKKYYKTQKFNECIGKIQDNNHPDIIQFIKNITKDINKFKDIEGFSYAVEESINEKEKLNRSYDMARQLVLLYKTPKFRSYIENIVKEETPETVASIKYIIGNQDEFKIVPDLGLALDLILGSIQSSSDTSPQITLDMLSK